jgi:uncharacterized membrane protein
MERSNRLPAFLAYLLLVFGCLYVFMFQRRNHLAMFHAKQSLAIVLTALIVPLIWGAVAWILVWLPFGFLLAMALFSLVIAAYIYLVGLWLLGIVYVSQNKIHSLPVIGSWAKRLPFG